MGLTTSHKNVVRVPPLRYRKTSSLARTSHEPARTMWFHWPREIIEPWFMSNGRVKGEPLTLNYLYSFLRINTLRWTILGRVSLSILRIDSTHDQSFREEFDKIRWIFYVIIWVHLNSLSAHSVSVSIEKTFLFISSLLSDSRHSLIVEKYDFIERRKRKKINFVWNIVWRMKILLPWPFYIRENER